MSKISRSSERSTRYSLVTDKWRQRHGNVQTENASFSDLIYNSSEKLKTCTKILEFVFAIFAFSLAVASPHTFVVTCANKSSTFVQYKYPYRMQREYIDLCRPLCALTTVDKSSVASQFYVFVGCLCFLITPVILGFYWFKKNLFQKYKALVIGNLVLSIIISLLWLGSSIAWSVGITHIRNATSTKNILRILRQFFPYFRGCKILGRRHESIGVSAFFGYVNFVVWAVDAWLIFKDINTRSHNQPTVTHEIQPNI